MCDEVPAGRTRLDTVRLSHARSSCALHPGKEMRARSGHRPRAHRQRRFPLRSARLPAPCAPDSQAGIRSSTLLVRAALPRECVPGQWSRLSLVVRAHFGIVLAGLGASR